jgi:hypothetical protein
MNEFTTMSDNDGGIDDNTIKETKVDVTRPDDALTYVAMIDRDDLPV